MSYRLTSLKSLFAGKVSLAAVVVTPLVLGGLALVGFQTYSLVTGKRFKDLNFDIGRLWEQVTNKQAIEPKQEVRFIKSVPNPNFVFPQNRDNTPLRTVELPVIKSKDAKLVSPNKYQQDVLPQFDKLEALPNISDIDIPTLLQTPFLTKYYNRLSSENLINPNISPYQGKWFIGFAFSPTLNYRTFSYDAHYVNGVAIDGNYRYTFGLTEKERNTSDKAITSFNIGIDFGKSINARSRIVSGIYFAKYGEQLQVKNADHTNLNYPNAAFMGHTPIYEVFDENQPEANIPYSNAYSYLEIPVGISFDFIHYDRSKISLDAALSFQKLLDVNALVYDFNTDYYYWITEKNQLFREYSMGGMLGITASQFVADKLELFVNPQFKINLNSTFQKPYPVNQNQYSAGLRIGFRQQLF